MISDGQSVDGEAVRALVATVQRQAGDLSEQLHALSARYSDGWQAHAAHTYVGAATQAYGGMLARSLRRHSGWARRVTPATGWPRW